VGVAVCEGKTRERVAAGGAKVVVQQGARLVGLRWPAGGTDEG
jgi:hypothetical protein